MTHPAEKDAPEPRWKRLARMDHEDGHPSGYDCDGLPLTGPFEVCPRVFPPGKED